MGKPNKAVLQVSYRVASVKKPHTIHICSKNDVFLCGLQAITVAVFQKRVIDTHQNILGVR